MRALIGTYTSGYPSAGLYVVDVSPDGRIEVQGVVPSIDPSFVVLHPQRQLAYVVNETGTEPGGLQVLSMVAGRQPQLVATLALAGHLPCHLAVLPDGSGLIVAHYGCGRVQWLGLSELGLPDGRGCVVQHVGSGPNPRRQASAHAHCVLVLENDVYVADLGQDAILHYRLAVGGDGLVQFVVQSRAAVHPGAGPRHLCASADGGRVYLSNELDNTVSLFARSARGDLQEQTWCSTLPPELNHSGARVRSATSEVALHPNGRWLYVGNRGHDSVVTCELLADGSPVAREWTATGGAHPRHFALVAEGAWLLVANRDGGSLQLFAVGTVAGELTAVGAPSVAVPAPVCVRWLPTALPH